MEYDVFISYSREDSVVAEELCAVLDKAGVNYWIDRNIHGSSNFLSEITQCIKSCKVLVFIASASSASSVFTQKEVLFAIKHKKCIIPYRIGEFHFDNNDELDFVFTNVQWVDSAAEVLESIKKLVKTVNTPMKSAANGLQSEVKSSVVPKKPKKNGLRWVVLSVVTVAILSLLGVALVKFYPSTSPDGQRDEYVELANCGLNMRMVYVEGGTFDMGATEEQNVSADTDEKPVHTVTLNSFYIAESEVTQAQWCKIMGSNPSHFKGDSRPVENVNWYEAKEFCIKLSKITGKKYTLPTEAQWEYAARGGIKHTGYVYSGSDNLDEVAWYDLNCQGETCPIKQKQPNELGLYDMSGNVYEWCLDYYGKYASSSQYEPSGAKSGRFRVLRGGSWFYGNQYCRVSFRSNKTPESRESNRGFRVVCLP